jgi:peptide/nickel transport system ATP-binding protein
MKPAANPAVNGTPLVEVRNLQLSLPVPGGRLHALRGVDFTLHAGRTLGLVGESGCGKSLTVHTLLGLQPQAATVSAAVLRVGGEDLLLTDEATLSRALRGRVAAMIFQEPMTSLNPVLPVGAQMIEALTVHGLASPAVATRRAVELLERVGIARAAERLAQFAHQFSGGQRQRIMIAMALMAEPQLLIADEPTTALDVTVQAEILSLLDGLRREFGMAMILVSHNLGLVSRVCDEVAVMYAGQVVERASAQALFGAPQHPYTRGLLAAVPKAPVDGQGLGLGRGLGQSHGLRLGAIPGTVPSLMTPPPGCAFAPRCHQAQPACHDSPPPWAQASNSHGVRCPLPPVPLPRADAEPAAASATGEPAEPGVALHGDGLMRRYRVGRGLFAKPAELRAVDGVSLSLQRGEVLAIVGESGCGKSTLARLLLGLEQPDDGHVRLGLDAPDALARARYIQPVFQDPMASLNPRRSVAEAIARPLVVHGLLHAAGRRERVLQLMHQVGLPTRLFHAFPGQLSGGQRQRVAIARALALEPQVLLCDEPTSALDVSVQAQILNLLADLKRERGLSLLLITHDLSVVRHMAERVLVMYLGRVVEEGPVAQVFDAPRHPYTRALVAAALPMAPGAGVPAPQMKPGRADPTAPRQGCAFAPRCPQAIETCRSEPPLRSGPDYRVACHLVPVPVPVPASPTMPHPEVTTWK